MKDTYGNERTTDRVIFWNYDEVPFESWLPNHVYQFQQHANTTLAKVCFDRETRILELSWFNMAEQLKTQTFQIPNPPALKMFIEALKWGSIMEINARLRLKAQLEQSK